MRPIVFTTIPIKADREETFAKSERDPRLISAIVGYRKLLEKNDVEVFARKNNCIATEKGYYFALYEDTLQEVNAKEEIEKQYIGTDGRVKVKLLDKDGAEHEFDIATLVAQQFVPNPLELKYVKFLDGNPKNCNKSNLYWSFEE